MICGCTQTDAGAGGLAREVGVIRPNREPRAPRDANSRADLRVPDPGLGGNSFSGSKLFDPSFPRNGLGLVDHDPRFASRCLGIIYKFNPSFSCI